MIESDIMIIEKTLETIQNPKVSLIIPTYNKKELLQEAIESALNQDYLNMEIIVTDDGSNDGTENMMKIYQGEDRIKYYRHSVNVGVRKNVYNAVYNVATGDYVSLLDHDDYLIDNNYISKAVEFLVDNPTVSFVFGNCKIYNMETQEVTIINNDMPTITNGHEYFINYEAKGYCHITSGLGAVYNRILAMEMQCSTEETYAMDLFLWLKLMLSGDVGFINSYAGVYRIHKNSLSNNLKIEYDYSTIKELEKLKETAIGKGISIETMNSWINYRVYAYVKWAVLMHSLNGKKENANNLLKSIKSSYPKTYERISDSLRKQKIIVA
jgi:glycosyltransferase involved in cell wall biosynthesis